jgi:hypothetical protein
MMKARLFVAAVLTAASVAGACGTGGSGVRKIIVNEGVCSGDVRFLRMKLGETNRVIVDNTQHSANQDGLSLILDRFPLLVKGDVPEGSTIGSPYSTIPIKSGAGEERSIDVEPTFSGTYKAQCNLSLHDEAGRRIVQTTVTFELVP